MKILFSFRNWYFYLYNAFIALNYDRYQYVIGGFILSHGVDACSRLQKESIYAEDIEEVWTLRWSLDPISTSFTHSQLWIIRLNGWNNSKTREGRRSCTCEPNDAGRSLDASAGARRDSRPRVGYVETRTVKCDYGFNNIDLIFLLSHQKEFKDLSILHVFRYSKNF